MYTSKEKALIDKLEIIIITYNRSELLLNTLEQLKGSPFSICKITILDNCSTDNSYEVACSKITNFPNLSVNSNKMNIGANANIIRAVELSNSLYTWVLCDDDEYDFSNCSDVIDAIIDEKYDLIHMGAHDDFGRFGGRASTAQNLILDGYPYFKYCSFLPCNLFRTSRFYNSIIKAYENIVNWYPHLPFLTDIYFDNELIYIAKERIVIAVIGSQEYTNIQQSEKWYNCADVLFKTKADKLIFLLNQRLIASNIKVKSVNRLIVSIALNILITKEFKFLKGIFSFCNIYQLFLLFSSLVLSPIWYVKNIFRNTY